MEFSWQGRRHVLRGLQGPKVRVIQGAHVPQVMEQGVHLCMLQLLPHNQSVVEACFAEWSCLNLQQEAIPA